MSDITLYGNNAKMSPAIAIMLDDKLFDRAKLIATYISRAEGFTPVHLLGKTEACFAVVTRALTWKLDPFAVAQSTYSPSAGKVGFEGKLCQAIIENSGQIEGGVEYEAYGDWSKVQGKFAIKETTKNDKFGKPKTTKYAQATYTDEDEKGLGVVARAQVIGEKKPREYKIDLRQAHPRNSTLWATDPLTQLKYRAARGLGNLAMPGIFMGVPVGDDVFENHHIKDVTPASESNDLNAQFLGDIVNPETGEITEATVRNFQTVQTNEDSSAVGTNSAPIPVIAIPTNEQGADWGRFAFNFIGHVNDAPSADWLNKLMRKYETQLKNCERDGAESYAEIKSTVAFRLKELS